jgi:hypothetical protein
MALLTEIPSIPEETELARLQSSFFTSFKQHVFLAAIDIPNTTQSFHPPYFPLALACLSSAVSPKTDLDGNILGANTSQTEVSASLFIAGLSLWCVVLEVDNREARLLEAIFAVRRFYEIFIVQFFFLHKTRTDSYFALSGITIIYLWYLVCR